jgi:signal transduction histidine kinase
LRRSAHRLDAGRWSQVLSNLLMNAAKHAYPTAVRAR